MYRSFVALAMLTVGVLGAIGDAAMAQQRTRDDWRPDRRGDWESLGAAEIGTRLERDVIPVSSGEGPFRAIGFTVNGNDVRIEDVKVIYRNGETQDLRVREAFRNGSRSRPIDLYGRGRRIDRIEVLYRSQGPVKIEFYGERGRGGGDQESRWEDLGCQRVGFLDDNDVIRVGRREGRFRALKLRVADEKLRLVSMKVVFENGGSQAFNVGTVIPAGAETYPVDLDGRNRAIDRIELKYLPQISLKRGASVCVLGFEGDDRGDRQRQR
ncbi:MAG: hypothetical protein ACKVP4_11760 [Hyphomicrobium sp.]